ncbi:MAG: exosortase C-terminal domain/associated protein EpsI, partial [Gammaproteobacteria bacterium]
MARGFLHDFEGWFIFMACVGILFLEMWIFAMVGKRSLADTFEVDVPPLSRFMVFLPQKKPAMPFTVALVCLLVGRVVSLNLKDREEFVPEHVSLSTFPLLLEEWRGRETALEQVYLDELQLDDYLLVTYSSPEEPMPVDLYVAYYASQSKGASIHSPRSCLPGGGWVVDQFDQYLVDSVGPEEAALQVNRAVVSLDENKQLVYYWFQQRGRNLTNEYIVKWYNFWDALTMRRTDGALVRVTTFVPDGGSLEEADIRLQEFVRMLDPKINYHLPQRSALKKES